MQKKINIDGFFAAISISVLSEFSHIFDFKMQFNYVIETDVERKASARGGVNSEK